MRCARILLMLVFAVSLLPAQEKPEGPTNEKAQKTYKEAMEFLSKHRLDLALDDFRKADKQDDGHCLICQKRMIQFGIEQRDWKSAETAASEMLAEAQGERNQALAHYQSGMVLFREGLYKKKEDLFERAHEEMTKALASAANFPDAIFTDGLALAHLQQDDAAKAQFERYSKMNSVEDIDRQRALRFIAQPELARGRIAPAFMVTTSDGQNISLDNLTGKVVLLDFWATWCAPCREALPHIRDIAQKFQGQPLVVLSISLDDSPQKWKDFITKNEMTWPQYCDGGFTGPVARLFGVDAIPHTFTIDADGMLQDEHVGDASIEGKLKKLIERAQQLQIAKKPAQ
jgi:peroxiredoxin